MYLRLSDIQLTNYDMPKQHLLLDRNITIHNHLANLFKIIVISLFTYVVLMTLCPYRQSTVTTFLDDLVPMIDSSILIDNLQFCFHNEIRPLHSYSKSMTSFYSFFIYYFIGRLPLSIYSLFNLFR